MEILFSTLALVSAVILHLGLFAESISVYQATDTGPVGAGDDNVILNPRFEDGLNNWSGKGCKIELHESMEDGKIFPQSGKFFASATNRTEIWNGIEQDITGRVQRKVAYQVTAVVRIHVDNVTSAGVQITLWLQEPDFREQYIAIANSQVTDKDWVQLQGEFLLNGFPSRLVIYLEGPSPGIDILVNSLVVKRAEKIPASARPISKNATFGGNIIENSYLDDGTTGWFPLGNCALSVGTGSPHVLPPMARDSLGTYESLSGRYIIVTNRSDSWMGPAQMITDKLKLYLTYQVSAWVRIGPGATGPQIVNVALSVDSQWINGGEVEFNDDKWHEIGGSFRIEKQPSNVMVYVQGPASGVDLLVSGLQIFPVNRQVRFKYLKKQIDKIRKRDIILKFSRPESSNTVRNSVKVRQIKNSFPLGSCVTRTGMDNEKFVKFLVKSFNWAVFENELKWSWTEPQEGKFNYRDADELLDLCKSYNIEVRGHCIFWEMEYAIQSWVRSLNASDLMTAVQNRLTGLLTRYKGKFRHYDVNNEMLHGSFYPDRLGKDIRANMFKTARELDPYATLFVNDYHIEDGSDIRSTPEKFTQQILDLQKQGAQVGGIGIQGHIDVPVGPIICSALDKLGTLGIPIWFTELDVSCPNEFVRADDLEVVLREAFAHPAVEGVILWGFWELYMSRKNAHLVNADGKINAAGKRFLSLKKEWLSHASGYIDELGEFRFRGFHGTYNVDFVSTTEKFNMTFVVDQDGVYKMRRFLTCCFNSLATKTNLKQEYQQESSASMEIQQDNNGNDHFETVSQNMSDSSSSNAPNIILNHDFSRGLYSWHPNCCDGFVLSADSGHSGFSTKPGGNYAVVSNRKECWQGLEQDITSRISPCSTYSISASVGVSGLVHYPTDVLATLKLEYQNSATSYLRIGKTSVSKEGWEKLGGTFSLATMPDRVVFYLEGPAPGVDLLVESVIITCSCPSECNNARPCAGDGDENIILNPEFEDGLNNWSGRGCKIVLHDSMADGKIVPLSGKVFASATERTQSWNGIQQEITERVQRKLAYEVTAVVRIFGNNVTSADIRATLWVQTPNLREQYIGHCQFAGKRYGLGAVAGKVPSKYFTVKHAEKIPPSPPPVIENPAFGVNIIQNSNLSDGTNGWFPLGNCSLNVATGSPHILPPTARDSLGPHEPLSGCYILATKRTQTWMGPAQMITDKIKLLLTYQVSAWAKIGSGANGPQNVNVALGVDSQWVNGGQVEINDDRWHEISGSFRIEKQPSKVMVYVQGPAAGVDLMLAGLQIFPVDRKSRFKHLRRQTDKIRKRDVTLKFSGGGFKQTNLDNEDFVHFFVKNFNWAVFGNELKWYWTEPQQGNFNYSDADEMLDMCKKNNIEARGHCIFWEVDGTVQQWIKALNKNDMMAAVQNHLTGLLTRYKGKFRHYDVNNEMLHGSFYQDHLGKDIRANMFKTANQLDPSAMLFVNDYHVEDGCDTRSSPEKYIEQILDLQEQGAPVGGIGIQGHIDSPVGPVVSSALDKLGILGLPIWFTELDVSSVNEYVRGDDLEVMLREAYAHPAVDGIMLWGFWELFMSRDNAHLVNAEGELNEAGKRYLALKKEWLSRAHGHIDEQGQFAFRGFHGTYVLEIETVSKKIMKTFVVDKGDSPLVVSIDL
ncbi:hypothetical protein OIU79_015721 [Salix purpurea]|uniref:GH10 domain-containing protein n=1 Tax=Salix purpurea TaxID=77065 RepID=A0A9Q0SQJ8_SALPP|nr:hypothetical protein OIU79_015721 [Salix purpurea]